MTKTTITAEDRREYQRRYYLQNRERIRRQRLQRKQRDPEGVKSADAARRDANRERLREKRLERYQKNKHTLSEKSKAYYVLHGDEIRKRRREHYAANRDKERAVRIARRKLNPDADRLKYLANKDARNRWHWQYQKNKIRQNPSFAVYKKVMCAMNRAVTRHKRGRRVSDKSRAVLLVGCVWPDFVAHIESLFSDGMSWGNHGQRGWHFDHIKPLSSFDLTDEKQLFEACHFTNVQPLWAADNIRKGAKIA